MKKWTMIAAATAAFALAGTGTAAADLGTPTVDVDTAKVAQSLEAALGGGNTVGFAYAITENGKLSVVGAGGKARARSRHGRTSGSKTSWPTPPGWGSSSAPPATRT